MKILVVGNVDPYERHALEIYYALSREISHRNIGFYMIPFENTREGREIKFVKTIFNERNLTKRLYRVSKRHRDFMRWWVNYIKENIISKGKLTPKYESLFKKHYSLIEGEFLSFSEVLPKAFPEIEYSSFDQ